MGSKGALLERRLGPSLKEIVADLLLETEVLHHFRMVLDLVKSILEVHGFQKDVEVSWHFILVEVVHDLFAAHRDFVIELDRYHSAHINKDHMMNGI